MPTFASHTRAWPDRGLRCLTLLSLLAMGSLGGGCSGPTPGTTADDHLEHHVPPHRPATFADGVQAVRTRVTKLAGGGDPAGGTDRAVQVAELGDILEWLPDLALDSDIRRSDWEQIHTLARSLLREYRESVAAGGGQPAADLERRFAGRLDQLTGLADRVRNDALPGEGPGEGPGPPVTPGK